MGVSTILIYIIAKDLWVETPEFRLLPERGFDIVSVEQNPRRSPAVLPYIISHFSAPPQ